MARPARTYRAARRNRAKLVRIDNKLTHMTISNIMEPAPERANGGASLVPTRVRIRGVSRKVYGAGNFPGGIRRRIDRGEFMGSMR